MCHAGLHEGILYQRCSLRNIGLHSLSQGVKVRSGANPQRHSFCRHREKPLDHSWTPRAMEGTSRISK